MSRPATYINALSGYFTLEYRQRDATTLFVRAIYLVALFRLTRLWLVADVFFYDFAPSFPRSFIGKVALFPAMLAQVDPLYFFVPATIALIAGLIARPNYIGNALLFWIILSFFKIRYPATNGADFVLLILSGLAIPLGHWPRLGGEYLTVLRITFYNAFRILIQVQLLTVYLISGWDKVKSGIWRSGEAFEYIANIDVMFNPVFTPLFEFKGLQLGMAWATILFELLFIPLVYIEKTRLPILVAGFIFHLIIWLMLGLPDFAWTMIAAYPIFLKDRDFAAIRSCWNKLHNRVVRQ